MKVCINNRNVKYNRKNRILTSFGNFCETIFTDNNTTIQPLPHQKKKLRSPPPRKYLSKIFTPLPQAKGGEGACHFLSRTLLMNYFWRNPNRRVLKHGISRDFEEK